MNRDIQTAVHALVDQAIHKVCQQIDHSLPYVVGDVPKVGKGAPAAPSNNDNPVLAGVLASELSVALNPFVDDLRREMRQVVALRFLDRAERLDGKEPTPPQPAAPQYPPQPSANGKASPPPLKGGYG